MKHLLRARHENVLGVVGWTKWEAGIAIITEYMPGGNLGDLLFDLDIPILPLLKLCWCTDISNGVSHIHTLFSKAKLVHGDIKPENILLTKNLRCKLGDFDGSKLVPTNDSLMSIITSMQPNSKEHITRQYAAPETLNNPQASLKHTHDVFSFGMVVYAILARVRPRQNCSVLEYEEFIMLGQRPNLSPIESQERDMLAAGNKKDKNIVNSLKRIMLQCWSQNPSNRPEMSKAHKAFSNMLSTFEMKNQDKARNNTLASFEMYRPAFDERETVAIDEIVSPDTLQGNL